MHSDMYTKIAIKSGNIASFRRLTMFLYDIEANAEEKTKKEEQYFLSSCFIDE